MRGVDILEPAMSGGCQRAGIDLEAHLIQERRLPLVAVAFVHVEVRVKAHFQVDALVLLPACHHRQHTVGDPALLNPSQLLNCSQENLRALQAHVLLRGQRLCDLLLQESVLVEGLRVVSCHHLEPRRGHRLHSVADVFGLVDLDGLDCAARRHQALPRIAVEQAPDLVLQIAAHLLHHPVALGNDLLDGQRPQIHIQACLDDEHGA
mmetsp:Transcript_117862/g.378003  ORF Transcript_117862/g.378003 Transcript_117862/m.378003 type:complete len:207 (-) Transcript_117862:146-766(-)